MGGCGGSVFFADESEDPADDVAGCELCEQYPSFSIGTQQRRASGGTLRIRFHESPSHRFDQDEQLVNCREPDAPDDVLHECGCGESDISGADNLPERSYCQEEAQMDTKRCTSAVGSCKGLL